MELYFNRRSPHEKKKITYKVVFSSLLKLIIFYGDNAVNAEEYKEDGLILLDTFENSNITVDKARINPIIYGPFTVSHLMSQLGIIIGII